MYCRFCGTEISDQSRFCVSCGKPQDFIEKPAVRIWPTVLCYIIGALFVIGGVLPYLLQGDFAEYNAYLSSHYIEGFSATVTAAVSCFRQFSSFLSPIFYFSSSILAVYIGLLIFKKESKITLPVVACVIVHAVSILFSGIINLLIYTAPGYVLSLYTTDATVIAVGEELIHTAPDLLYYYQDNAICRLIISIILIGLAVVFLLIKKRHMNSETNDNKNTASVGNLIMILAVSLLSVVSTILSTYLAGYFYGSCF